MATARSDEGQTAADDSTDADDQLTDSSGRGRFRSALLLVVGVSVVLGAGAAIAVGRDESSERTWAGTLLGSPQSMPSITLDDTAGDSFDLAEGASGRVTLLMFGYTSCPDVCPISLATLASALRGMPPEVSDKVRMVFVGVDPDRDTPERLREFLDEFDESFIGLTGQVGALEAAQREANVPLASLAPPEPDGSYAVGHATQMIAFQGEAARIVYPFGTREGDWIRDLPRLVDGELPKHDEAASP
jgi:protein SCO1/2